MTNYEFYKNKINEIEKTSAVALANNEPLPCRGLCCEECQRHIYESLGLVTCSVVKFMDWANEEHEEPKINLPEGIAVDTPILVSNDGIDWHKRHFAGFKNTSRVGVWEDGKTSFTTDVIFYWTHAKLPDKENSDE